MKYFRWWFPLIPLFKCAMWCQPPPQLSTTSVWTALGVNPRKMPLANASCHLTRRHSEFGSLPCARGLPCAWLRAWPAATATSGRRTPACESSSRERIELSCSFPSLFGDPLPCWVTRILFIGHGRPLMVCFKPRDPVSPISSHPSCYFPCWF